MSKNCIAAILGGACLIFVGLNEAKQSSAGRKEPQEITCAKLVDEGYGSNAHVRMTDFYLCEHEYVYEKKLVDWTAAWVPVVPKGGPLHQAMLARASDPRTASTPLGKDIKIIVLFPKARSEKDVKEAAKRETIQGLVIKPVQLLDREKERLLEESYPGLRFGDCLILVEGRQPSSHGKTVAVTGAGLALVVAGSAPPLLAWRKRRKSEWIVINKR